MESWNNSRAARAAAPPAAAASRRAAAPLASRQPNSHPETKNYWRIK